MAINISNLFNRSAGVTSYLSPTGSSSGQSPLNVLTLLDLVPEEIDQQFLELFVEETTDLQGETKAEGEDDELGDDVSKALPEEGTDTNEKDKKEIDLKTEQPLFPEQISHPVMSIRQAWLNL